MAEQIISPGVFTRENDLSFLPQGIGQIGAAIVGPTVKGPAFVPTVLRSFADFERKFGPLSNETFVPQTVREYLRNAGTVTVCRVLAGGGYTYSHTGTENKVVAFTSGLTRASSTVTFTDACTNDQTITIVAADGTSQLYTVKASTDSASQEFAAAGDNAAGKALVGNINFEDAGNAIYGKVSASWSDGGSTVTLVQLQSGVGGNTTITETLDSATATAFTGGTDLLISLAAPAKSLNAAPDLGNTSILGEQETSFGIHPNMSQSFKLTFDGDQGVSANDPAKVTFDTTKQQYITKQVGKDSYASKNGVVTYAGMPGYLFQNFEDLQKEILSTTTDTTSTVNDEVTGPGIAHDAISTLSGYPALNAGSMITASFNTATLTYSGGPNMSQEEGYSMATTPYIVSQYVDDEKNVKELFRIHTIAHGTSTNKDYKVSITDIKEPDNIDGLEQYSKFTVLVRKYSDKDANPNIIEEYKGVDLDPHSVNYISRRIGDSYPQYNDTLGKLEILGNFPNVSNIIRVQVQDQVEAKSYSPKLSPKGFKAVYDPIPTASFTTHHFRYPSCSYEGTQVVGTEYSSRGMLGWKFNDKKRDNENWIKPLTDTLESNCAGIFSVEDFHGHNDSALWSGSLSASVDETGKEGPAASQLKFTVPFQGGDDGIAPFTVKFTGGESTIDEIQYAQGTNLYGMNLSTSAQAGYKGYKKALDILSNQDEYDINMLALPGVIKQLHSVLTTKAIDMVETRGDAFFVMDLARGDSSVNDAVGHASGLDTNYAAVYYPWVKVLDTSVNRPILVPPSVIVPGAIAASDRIAAEWFAPAGLNRGVLGKVLSARIRLNQAERDKLYEAKINPIATFPQTGVCIWGQKTLQERATALDRINVRRLLIALKKFIASSSRYLVFEQNTLDTRARFLNIVNPYLESIQSNQGLFAFRVQMDESNNTPDVIDRNQLVGAIYLQPTRTAEYIVLDFNVMPTGATFD